MLRTGTVTRKRAAADSAQSRERDGPARNHRSRRNVTPGLPRTSSPFCQGRDDETRNPECRGNAQAEFQGGSSMSSRNTYIAGLLTAMVLWAGSAALAAVQYDAMLEWNGPKYRVINGASVSQNTDTPVVDIPFQNPFGIAVREHATGGRDVVYVLDSGNNRIQAFEVNATYNLTSQSDFTFQAGGTSAASEWDTDNINLAEWAAVATNWVVPFSEVVTIDGIVWTRVESLAGYD